MSRNGTARLTSAAGDGATAAGAPWHRLVPFLLLPLGMIYCRVHEILFGETRSTLVEAFFWALATLVPWVVAALAFQASVAPGEHRAALMRRAFLLAASAWVASAIAALLLGAGAEHAFYSRLPLLAVALLAAALYPIPAAAIYCGGNSASHESGAPVAPGEILYASAAGNYVELHAGERTVIWRQTMQNAERILRPAGFVRVHRSYLVPLRSIEDIDRGRKGPVALALRDGPRLPVSNRYAANLKSQAA